MLLGITRINLVHIGRTILKWLVDQPISRITMVHMVQNYMVEWHADHCNNH